MEVADINDNPPRFHASLYTGFAREDAAIGTNIITSIAAFDNDLVNKLSSLLLIKCCMLCDLGRQ